MNFIIFVACNLWLCCASESVFSVELEKSTSQKKPATTEISKWQSNQMRADIRQQNLHVHIIPAHLDTRHDVPVFNDLNAEYTVAVQIGTPGRTFHLVVDTGSADIWIPSGASQSATRLQHRHYHWGTSSEHGLDRIGLTNTYESAMRSARYAHDTLRIGNIVIQNQDYGEFSEPSDLAISSLRRPGIFGLAYDTISTNGAIPPLYNMIQQGLIDQPMFAMYLNDETRRARSSVLTFGGVNREYFTGQLIQIPVSRKGYWEIQLDAITFGNSTVQMDDTGAIFDTGTSLLVLPATIAVLLNMQIGAKENISTGIYAVDCGVRQSGPNLTLTLTGHNFTITAEHYVVHVGESCISAFTGFDYIRPLVILGASFLRQWYSVYNLANNSVGLAQAIH